MKTNGATWKAYLASWPEDQWFDDSDETFDGVEATDLEPADGSVVEFTCGVVYKNAGDHEGTALTSHFRKWLKKRNMIAIVVDVPVDRLDAFKDYLNSIGGNTLI